MTAPHVFVAATGPADAESLRRDLVAAGYDVTVVTDGQEGVDRLAGGELRPDAIVAGTGIAGTDEYDAVLNSHARLREREEELRATRAALEEQVDLADRQRRELEGSRNELRDILDTARVATWVVDLDTGRFRWSPNARAVLGLSPATPIDDLEDFLATLQDDDAYALRALVGGLLDGTAEPLPEDWEFRIVGDDGQLRWFASRGQLVAGASGNVVSGVTLDISRRRQLEQALLEREQMLSGVLAASPDGIVVSALDGTIRFASDGIREVVGVGPDELVGRHPIQFVVEADRARVVAATLSLPTSPDGVRQTRFRVVDARGDTVTVDCRLRLLTSTDGHGDGFVTVVRDVTEQAALEAELERARDDAEAANRAKSEYLSRMSHELRTPMNSVLGFAQLLERSDLTPDDQDSVDRILTAGRHLLQLIDDVLDIARIEAGRLRVSVEPVAVAQVVTSSLDLLSPQVRAQRLELAVGPDEQARVVLADRQRLAQVIINLLSNSVKYNRPGGKVSVDWTEARPGWCRISVSDTGPGIPADLHPQLFQPFERLGADETGIQGSGLGLALCKALVEAMGGVIGSDSEPGRGSTFWVELPLATAERSQDTASSDRPAARENGHARPLTVLYVEDNPLNVELVRKALPRGTELLHAGTGDGGLATLRECLPDVVLLDLQLPGMSGREVLAHIRADRRLAHLPVVVVSADATSGSVEEVQALGVDAYLTKPFDLRHLETVVDDLGRGRRTRRRDGSRGGW